MEVSCAVSSWAIARNCTMKHILYILYFMYIYALLLCIYIYSIQILPPCSSMFCNRPVIEGPSRRPSAQADPPVPHATLQNVFLSCKFVLHCVALHYIRLHYISSHCIQLLCRNHRDIRWESHNAPCCCSKSRSMEKNDDHSDHNNNNNVQVRPDLVSLLPSWARTSPPP